MVKLTDESGAVIKTYEYDSFGNEVNPDKKDENPFRYCGEYYDKETGEIYLRARYYQPAVGRFLTRDTYTGEEDEPLSLQLYAYCGYDGVNYVDPDGHCMQKVLTTIRAIGNNTYKLIKKQHNREMKNFINGKKKKVKKETIKWWSEYGAYKNGVVFTYSQSSWNKYDTAIMAFNNYWISKLNVSKKLRVNPNYIKAMVYNESTMGETDSKDIMTAFNPYDPDVHILAKNENGYKKYLGNGYDPNEGISFNLPKKGYKAVKNLYSKNNTVQKKRINYQLSLCFGIRWLYFKTINYGSVIKGIARYNGGGDQEYIRKIRNTLRENNQSKLVKGNKWNKDTDYFWR